MEQLQGLIDDYVEWCRHNAAKKDPLRVAFGMGSAEDNPPNHMAFYEAVGTWVQDFENAGPDQAQLLQTLRLLLFAAAQQDKTQAKWYLIAIQGWAKPLIERLEEPGRRVLAQEYQTRYPKNRRLPVQTELCRLLTENSREGRFLFGKAKV